MATPLSSVSSTATSTPTATRLENEINEARESTVSDFNDFLTLLTAQLQNQDPLQPLDSTQFVEQLASFASVEQQVGTNEKLTRLISQGEAQEIGQLGVWIGQTIEGRDALYPLSGSGLTVDVPSQQDAVSVEAIITDENDVTVARVTVTDPSQPFTWDGTKTDGQQASPGDYGVSFAYQFDDRSPTRIDASSTGRVTEARIDSDGPLLILDSGARVRPDTVTALRVSEDSAT